MDAKPASSSERAGAGEPDGPEESAERYGPLELRRLRKADGRRLIAYYRAEPSADAAEREP